MLYTYTGRALDPTYDHDYLGLWYRVASQIEAFSAQVIAAGPSPGTVWLAGYSEHQERVVYLERRTAELYQAHRALREVTL